MQMLRQIANRTIAVLGRSHSVNLFCALSCYFVAEAGAAIDSSAYPGPVNGSRVLRMRAPAVSIDWLLPLWRVSGGGDDTCGARRLKQLTDLGNRSGGIIALWNPCGAYAHGDLQDAVYNWMRRVPSLQALGEYKDPLVSWKDMAQRAGRGQGLNHSIRAYAQRASVAAGSLRALVSAGPNNLGVLVETQPAHFPSSNFVNFVNATGSAGTELPIDRPGSYERFLVSSSLWLHSILRTPAGGEQAVAAMRIQRPAFSSWAQRAGNFQPSYAFGAASLCDARNVSCFTDASLRGELHARDCMVAPRPSHANWRRSDSVASEWDHPLDWHVQAEHAAAAAVDVPVLRAFSARSARADLHPGLQKGVSSAAAIFDCAHSSLAPGAYDGEVNALAHILGRDV